MTATLKIKNAAGYSEWKKSYLNSLLKLQRYGGKKSDVIRNSQNLGKTIYHLFYDDTIFLSRYILEF